MYTVHVLLTIVSEWVVVLFTSRLLKEHVNELRRVFKAYAQGAGMKLAQFMRLACNHMGFLSS